MPPTPVSRSTASLASCQSTDLERDMIEMNETSEAEKDAEPTTPIRSGTSEEQEEDHFKPKTFKFWMILFSNFLALFLVALDRTIVATAVPRITDEFHSLGDIGWYGSAYMLTTSASQLLFGRIYKFYSMKWTFLICVIVFEIGSAICGAAPTSTIFIVGRAIAGAASAGIFSGCMLIMIPMIPLHKRPMFQGMFGMVFGIASVMGPLVGGAFTGGVTWRWCFYINLPVGAITLVFMMFFWNPPKQHFEPAPVRTHIKRLDPWGTAFFLPAVVCLLLALQWGGSTYAWDNWKIVMLFALFAVGMVCFIFIQIHKPDTATIPARIIMQRSILSGTLFTFCLAGSMLMMVYFVPIWFQTAKGVDPLKSGIYTLPLVLSLVISSLLSGIVTQKIGYYVPSMLLAPCIMSTGEGLMTTFTPETGSSHWIAYQFLAGFGLGLGMQTANLAVQTVLPKDDVSTGIAIIFFVQQLGGAVFTTVGQTLLSNILVSKLEGVPGLDAQAIVNNGATELAALVPPEDLDLVIHAYNYACTRIFLTGMALAFGALLSALFMEWRSIKKGKQGPPPAKPAAEDPEAADQKPGKIPGPAIKLGEGADGPPPRTGNTTRSNRNTMAESARSEVTVVASESGAHVVAKTEEEAPAKKSEAGLHAITPEEGAEEEGRQQAPHGEDHVIKTDDDTNIRNRLSATESEAKPPPLPERMASPAPASASERAESTTDGGDPFSDQEGSTAGGSRRRRRDVFVDAMSSQDEDINLDTAVRR